MKKKVIRNANQMFKIIKTRFKEFVQFGLNGLIAQKAVVEEEPKQGLTNVQMKGKVEHVIALKIRAQEQVNIIKKLL